MWNSKSVVYVSVTYIINKNISFPLYLRVSLTHGTTFSRTFTILKLS